MKHEMKDRKGRLVRKGNHVRVVSIDQSVIQNLLENEKKDVNTMLGEVFEVEDVDEYGSAWVTKWWKRGNEESESHSLGLFSSEMELIENE